MFITQQVESQYYNHHDEAIDADLAIWITDLMTVSQKLVE